LRERERVEAKTLHNNTEITNQVITMSKTYVKDMTVQRTISLPLSVLEDVKGESELMGCGFSEATVKLLRIALRTRDEYRRQEELQQKDLLEKMRTGTKQ